MRVTGAKSAFVVAVLALMGCKVKGLSLPDTDVPPDTGADRAGGGAEDGPASDAAVDFGKVARPDVGVDRPDSAWIDVFVPDGPVSPGVDAPADTPIPDAGVEDRPVSLPDSADTVALRIPDTGAHPDTRPVPDGALDRPAPDATWSDLDCEGNEVESSDTDAIITADAVVEPDSAISAPDTLLADTAEADTAVEPPVFIVAGGGRGPLSTTITTNGTAVDSVPTINDQTIRVMLRTTAAGSAVRVKFTNRYGSEEVSFAAAHVAIRSSGGSIVPGSDRALSFDGFPGLGILPGHEDWSDAVDLEVARGDTLAISLYVSGQVKPTTEAGRGDLVWMNHYLSSPGDHTAETTMPAATAGPSTTHKILFVSEIYVLPPGPAATLVTLGDSITESACSTSANGDWPDLLSDRMPALPDGTVVSVFNAGIGSGRFASSDGAGLRGLLRLDELLLLPKVRWVTILMGVNDISYEHAAASDLIAAYQTAIGNAHAVGVKVIGIPILPFKGSKKDEGTNWETAQAVNDWIRTPGNGFDGIIDFEPVLDPEHTGAMKADLTADKVHPNQAGYTAMANAIDLSIFQ